jgi:hypothetical protein
VEVAEPTVGGPRPAASTTGRRRSTGCAPAPLDDGEARGVPAALGDQALGAVVRERLASTSPERTTGTVDGRR